MDSTILQLIEIGLAAAGLGYGLYEAWRRRKTVSSAKVYVRTHPFEVAKIEQSAQWAWNNIRNAHEHALLIPDCEERNRVLHFLMLGTGDSAAAQRMCSILFNTLLAFQEAEFGTRDITYPKKETLDLIRAELERENA